MAEEWPCPVPGCSKKFDSEAALMGHVGGQHKGYKYRAGGYMESPDLGGADVYEIDEPIDLLDNLRQILINNGAGRQREAIIDLFRYYDPSDIDALDGILMNSNIAVNKRKLIIDSWKKRMNIMEPENNNGNGKRAQAPYMDPTQVTPNDMTKMMSNPMMMMQWMRDVQMNAQMTKFMMKVFEESYGDMWGSGNKENGGQQKLPPDVQRIVDEWREMKERDKLRDFAKPLVEEIRDLRRELEEVKRKPADDGGDIEKMVTKIKMLEMLGANKQAEEMRLRMEEKMELARLDRDKAAREFDVQREALRNEATKANYDALRTMFESKVERLQESLREKETTSSRDTVMRTIQEAKEIKAAMDELGGSRNEDAAEERKMALYGEVIKAASTAFGVLGSAMNQNQAGPPVMQRPTNPVAAQVSVEPNETWTFTCPTEGCGRETAVTGTPTKIVCPGCHKVFVNRDAASPPPVAASPPPLPNPEPTPVESIGTFSGGLGTPPLDTSVPMDIVAQRRAELEMLSREELDSIATAMGFDPGLYPNKTMLAEEIVRARYPGM